MFGQSGLFCVIAFERCSSLYYETSHVDSRCKRSIPETRRKRPPEQPFFPVWAAAHHPSSRSCATPAVRQPATGRNRCKSHLAQLQVEAERTWLQAVVSRFVSFFNFSPLFFLLEWCFTGSMKKWQKEILNSFCFLWVVRWAKDQLRTAK